jgi:UDPglucose--hexose-1-phosphate uridylyltransferase
MLGEWVIVTPKRAGRPFQDSDYQCPFCPDQEETEGSWDVLTLDNRFPSLHLKEGPIPLNNDIVLEAPGFGSCKIIILSPNHDEQIEVMNDKQLLKVLNEYVKVFSELDEKEGIEYVFQFENRGKSIGVSLNHPHAQVYALPFIPPRIAKEIERAQKIWKTEEFCIVCNVVEKELEVGHRIIKESKNFVSLLPFAARLPYEVHIYPKDHVGSLIELEGHLQELGLMIRDTVQRYTKIFDETAYVMAFHTRPSTGEHPYWHFHVEFYPPWRDRKRIKYLAGLESGTWTFTNDSSPEEKAKELREAL